MSKAVVPEARFQRDAPSRPVEVEPLDEDHDPLSGQPELLREIAEVAGVEAAITLADRRGGNRVYFPRPDTLGPHHWLVDCVGATPARLLCEHFYGIELELPIGSLSKAERHARVQLEEVPHIRRGEVAVRPGAGVAGTSCNRLGAWARAAR